MVELNLASMATAFVSLGIGLGAGVKLIVPLFKRNGYGNGRQSMDYVPKDWCERTHAAEEKRHDELMAHSWGLSGKSSITSIPGPPTSRAH